MELNMRKFLFATALLAFIFASSVWAADISGTWTLKMKNPQDADESFDLIVKDAGGNLTITGTHPQLQDLTGTGTVTGDAVIMNIKTSSVPVEFIFTGKVAGNMMSGTRKIIVGSGDAQGGAAGSAQGMATGGQGNPDGAPAAGGQSPAGRQGAPGGAGRSGTSGGTEGGGMAEVSASGQPVSNAWTAVKK